MTSALNGKLVLVTGGSRGIGKAIACALARAGAEVIIAARGVEGSRKAAEEITASGGRATAVAMDIASEDSVREATGELLETHGTIPLLVNNAGIVQDQLLLRMKEEAWDQVIGTNLTGVYRLCRALVPGMFRARFGRIVNVTSVVASAGNPGQTNYAAAKAGIEGFSRSLARELASRNIRVNCVAPGFVDTEMTRRLDDRARKAQIDRIPLRRLGTPEDVASAVVFLMGEGGSYITGTTLHVNGGMFL